jgi:hypothetical protein
LNVETVVLQLPVANETIVDGGIDGPLLVVAFEKK